MLVFELLGGEVLKLAVALEHKDRLQVGLEVLAAVPRARLKKLHILFHFEN